MFEDNLSIRETKKVQKNRNAVLVTIFLLFIVTLPQILLGVIVIPGVLQGVRPGPEEIARHMSADAYILSVLYGTILASILFYLFARKYLNRNNASLGLKSNDKLKNYIKGAIIGLIMMTGVFLQLKIYDQAQISLNYKNVSPAIFFVFLIGWMLQGFSEELMCRSILMNYFAAYNGVKSAIISNSLIFAIMHIGNPGFGLLAFINLFLMGVIFSLLFYISDDIFMPAAAHTFWNFSQANIYGISVSGLSQTSTNLIKTKLVGNSYLTGGAFGVEASFLTLWIEVMVVIIFINAAKKKSKEEASKFSLENN
ncbi:CAAX amino terminal protease self- immunity [Anaerococcus octavius]|uniref:CAAX amino terminal protease self- immunity n=1 Tax=Anaerococcus octavius TaxID=54007 RepID=A0A380WYF0_9FIRM|nr:CPBP family intramembrane glutamic endopeptidase [Anaerococcus octavius]SUU93184.1 CAAX amino terminal protease self- immunity [Anaerococcus octavius]